MCDKGGWGVEGAGGVLKGGWATKLVALIWWCSSCFTCLHYWGQSNSISRDWTGTSDSLETDPKAFLGASLALSGFSSACVACWSHFKRGVTKKVTGVCGLKVQGLRAGAALLHQVLTGGDCCVGYIADL